ncbi:MAG: ABC transporter ATP-binding protein [Coriobacteriia bacterium]
MRCGRVTEGEGPVPQSRAILEAEDLSFSYGGPKVWEGVSLTLLSGQMTVLLGANGAGKSTLLRCLAGWSPLDSGTVRFCGEPLRSSDRGFRRRLVLVNDTPPFYDDLTAEEHVMFVLRANRMSEREVEARRLLDRFGLQPHGAAYPSSFSRGMRYKLALVMGLALAPDLVLLDEPFGPLDVDSARLLIEDLDLAAKRGAAILLSSHQLPPSMQPDAFLVLEHGGLRVEGGASSGAEGMHITLEREAMMVGPATVEDRA